MKAKLAEIEPKAQLLDTAFANRREQPLRLAEVVRKFSGVNTLAIKRDLKMEGFLYKAAGQYRVYAKYRDSHFVEKFNPYNGKQDIYATTKGAGIIAGMYQNGSLTMKVGH